MATETTLLIQPILPVTDEWIHLITTIYAQFVTEGIYSAEEVEAMLDPQQHSVSWLPEGGYVQVVSLGGFIGPAFVGSVDLLRRGNEIAVIEQLAVYPQHRCRGYGRQLVREAVGWARRLRYPTLEVFAIEREAKAVAFWRNLLGVESNADGYLELLGTRRPAVGWRLPTAEISV